MAKRKTKPTEPASSARPMTYAERDAQAFDFLERCTVALERLASAFLPPASDASAEALSDIPDPHDTPRSPEPEPEPEPARSPRTPAKRARASIARRPR